MIEFNLSFLIQNDSDKHFDHHLVLKRVNIFFKHSLCFYRGQPHPHWANCGKLQRVAHGYCVDVWTKTSHTQLRVWVTNTETSLWVSSTRTGKWFFNISPLSNSCSNYLGSNMFMVLCFLLSKFQLKEYHFQMLEVVACHFFWIVENVYGIVHWSHTPMFFVL